VLGMRLEFGNRAGHWLHPICRCAQHGRGELAPCGRAGC
jgi:hypothetical protein